MRYSKGVMWLDDCRIPHNEPIKIMKPLGPLLTLPGYTYTEVQVEKAYKSLLEEAEKKSFWDKVVSIRGFDDVNKTYPLAARLVYSRDPEFVKSALTSCLRQQYSAAKKEVTSAQSTPPQTKDQRSGLDGLHSP
jgi:hypothetical protein